MCGSNRVRCMSQCILLPMAVDPYVYVNPESISYSTFYFHLLPHYDFHPYTPVYPPSVLTYLDTPIQGIYPPKTLSRDHELESPPP